MERLRILLNQMVSEKTADVFLNEIRNRPPVLLVKLVQERESLNSLLNQIGISPGLDRVGVITALEIWSKEYEQGPLAIEKEEKQRSMAIIEKEEEQGPLAIEKEEEQGSMAIIEKEEEKSLGTDEKLVVQKSIREFLREINFPQEKLDNYAALLGDQNFLTVQDLVDYPPEEIDLEKYGISQGKDRKQIIVAIQKIKGPTQQAQDLPEPSQIIINKIVLLNTHPLLHEVIHALSGLQSPSVTAVQFKSNSTFLNPLPLQIGHPSRLDLRLFDGDLGIPNRRSETVTELLKSLDESQDLNFAVPQLILSGSGVGKTKTLFDLLKERYGILYDCSNAGKDFERMESEITRLTIDKSKAPIYETDCDYELHLTIAARGIALLLYHANTALTPKDWLYCQLNGLASNHYEMFLLRIRDYLIWKFKKPNDIDEFCITLLEHLKNYFKQRLVIVIDEANILLDKLLNTFQSKDQRPRSRPLFTFVVDRVMRLPTMLVVAGTRLELKDKDLWESVAAKQGASRGKNQQKTHVNLPLMTRQTGSIFISSLFKSEYKRIAEKLFFKDLTPPERFRFLTSWCEILAEKDDSKILIINKQDAKEQLKASLNSYLELLKKLNPSIDWNIPAIIGRFEDKNGKYHTYQLFCELVYSFFMLNGIVKTEKTKEWMAGGFCRLTNTQDGYQYKIDEALIIECVINHLKNQNVFLTDYYVEQIQNVVSASAAGSMMDIFFALAFYDFQEKLNFNGTKNFQPAITSFYYYNTTNENENTPLHELLKKNNQYILPKHITGPDGLLRCDDVLYIIASKTTKRDGRSVDLCEVEKNFNRTDLNNLFPGRTSEKDENNRSTVLKYIATNIHWVVRIHFVFPGPSRNANFPSTKREKDLILKISPGSKRKHQEEVKAIPQDVFNVSLQNLTDYFPPNLVEHIKKMYH